MTPEVKVKVFQPFKVRSAAAEAGGDCGSAKESLKNITVRFVFFFNNPGPCMALGLAGRLPTSSSSRLLQASSHFVK